MAAAEAQATGTPVIAYAAGALPEVIVPGKTGFLVPVGDIGAAARAVESVRSIQRVDCRRHAEATLDLQDTITAHERVYRQVQMSKGAIRHA